MPAAKTAATPTKLVPKAASPASATPSRIRLSKAMAKQSNGGLPKKLKLRSSRYKLPESEYDQLTALKKHLLTLGISAKKSELLRAGFALLVSLPDAQLKAALASVQSINVQQRKTTNKTSAAKATTKAAPAAS
jgi:hypothetical protein